MTDKATYSRIIRAVKDSGIIPTYRVREKIARRYLSGSGIEIGALHQPTKVKAVCRYLDHRTKEENEEVLPELKGKIVGTDIVDDCRTMNTVPDGSQDFIIANHVLEHMPDTLATIRVWVGKLKSGGHLMYTLPIGSRCFDRDRPTTPVEHFIVDYCRGVDGHQWYDRKHYEEWLDTAHLRLGGSPDVTVEQLLREQAEIHFHVFSPRTVRLVAHLATQVAPASAVKIKSGKFGAEYTTLLRKQ